MIYNEQELRPLGGGEDRLKAGFLPPALARMVQVIWAEIIPDTEQLRASLCEGEPLRYGHNIPGIRSQWGTKR